MTTETTISLAEMKKMVKDNLGTPPSNLNAAITLQGQKFLAENAKGEFVMATILPNVSAKGKVQAELACCVDGCNETHIREMSDWHQSMKCRTHAQLAKVRLTDEEKEARKVARAMKAIEAKNAKKVAEGLDGANI